MRTLIRFSSGLLLVACASSSTQRPAAPPYTGPLDFPSERAADFFDRQKIVASYDGHSFGFDAVLQKRGNELTLLGLTPFGSRAFVVTQKGADVSFQTYVGTALPFPPRYMLIDVHRVFFPADPATEAAPFEGARTFSAEGEVIAETWHEGRLFHRTFSRSDGRLPGKIVVDYDGGLGDDSSHPGHVVLTNGWYGYRLDITTTSHKPL
jgi:Protein of unknown function (DUF3261)